MAALQKHDPFGFELAATGTNCRWSEDWLRDALGYKGANSFRMVVMSAMKACITANINPSTDFTMTGDGTFSFSRVAVFLIVIKSDSRKPQVAALQVHLARIANEVASRFEQATALDRIVIRDDVADGVRSLVNTAQGKGVTDFARFMNAGYRGMYNMSLADLKEYKGVPANENLLDRMNPPELAANHFRVTQTDELMKRSPEWGQFAAEGAAHRVGAAVRDTMVHLSGTIPEDMPVAADNIRESRKELKQADTRLRQYDKLPRSTRLFNTLSDDPNDALDPGYTPEPEESNENE